MAIVFWWVSLKKSTLNYAFCIDFSKMKYNLLDFRPIGEIIRRHLSYNQRRELYTLIHHTAFRILNHPSSDSNILYSMTENEALQRAIFNTIKKYVSREIRRDQIETI